MSLGITYAPITAPLAERYPALVANAIEKIHAEHLDTSEGRQAFLSSRLPLIAQKTIALSEEVVRLLRQEAGSTDLSRGYEIANTFKEKMATLNNVLLIVEDSKRLGRDFQRIDAALKKTPPLEQHEEEMLIRVAKISAYLANMDLNAAANP